MAGEREKEEGKGFTVQDRRRFSSVTGEAREDTFEQPQVSKTFDSDQAASAAQGQTQVNQQKLPEINFSMFIISLSTQALMHLGEIPNPLTKAPEVDIPMAKQMIDILGMLQEKTRSNLDASETNLMEDILFDLRMKYVEAVKKR